MKHNMQPFYPTLLFSFHTSEKLNAPIFPEYGGLGPLVAELKLKMQIIDDDGGLKAHYRCN